MCLSQLYLPRSEITVFSDCKIEFKYDILPKQSPKTEKDRFRNERLKRLHENEKKQTITISIAAGTYDTEVIVDLINQAIQNNEDLQTYRQKTELVLFNGKSFFREIPKIVDTQARIAFQLQLAWFCQSPKTRDSFYHNEQFFKTCFTIAIVIKDLFMVEFFIIFYIVI